MLKVVARRSVDRRPTAGPRLGCRSGAAVRHPLALDAQSNILIADTANNKIRQVGVKTNTIATVIGSGAAGTTGTEGDGGYPLLAKLNSPAGVVAGSISVSDTASNTVRTVTANLNPDDGRPALGIGQITSCSVSLNSVATADWLLPLLPLTLMLGRKRFGRLFIRLRRAGLAA